MSYSIVQKFIVHNRSHIVLKPRGIALHETATSGATAENEHKYFNGAERNASAHAFVDWNSIIQTIPWNEKAWHACEPANSMFIGIELCHATNQAQFDAVWNRAVWLFAYLFINVLHINTITKNNLMSHAEISAKWHNTTHIDPVGYFKQYGKTVDMFRVAVQKEINNQIQPAKANTVKPKEVEEGMKIVIPFGVADIGSAQILASNIKAAVLDWNLVGLEDDVIQVGGPADVQPKKPCKSFKVVTGASRKETAKNVIAQLQ
jgi:N-acetylmuramoyl-L-alanine amidase